MSQPTLFEPVDVHAAPLTSPLPTEQWGVFGHSVQKPPFDVLGAILERLRARGLHVVRGSWLTADDALSDAEIVREIE